MKETLFNLHICGMIATCIVQPKDYCFDEFNLTHGYEYMQIWTCHY